jgi:hypothetical protein
VTSTTNALSKNDGLIGRLHEKADDAVATSADESVEQARGQVPVVVSSQQTATPSTSLFETSLEGLDGISPIAEALLSSPAKHAQVAWMN